MLTIALPASLESALIAAAQEQGRSVDDYAGQLLAEGMTLQQDRARVDAVLAGLPTVSAAAADQWLAELATGVATPCPR
jgi:hypothetical protein